MEPRSFLGESRRYGAIKGVLTCQGREPRWILRKIEDGMLAVSLREMIQHGRREAEEEHP
jgi:hypothetical protein